MSSKQRYDYSAQNLWIPGFVLREKEMKDLSKDKVPVS